MKQIITLALITSSFLGFSQKKVFNREFTIPEKTPLVFSYFGSLGIHPGVKAGFEYSLLFKEKTKENKRRTKTIRKNLLLLPSVSFYSHRDSHKGLLLSVDLIWRRYTKRLYIIDVSAGLGHYTRFNSGTTYRVTPSKIETIKNARRSYFSPSLSASFGKRLQFIKSYSTDIYIRNTYHIYTNFNSLIGNDTSFELGFRMDLNRGISQDPKIK